MKMKKFVLIFNILFLLGLTLLSCDIKETKYLGKGYKLDFENEGYLLINAKNRVIVNYYVLDFNFNSSYIIVNQKPWDSIVGKAEEYKSYYDCEKIFKYSSFHQYWIINKTNDSVYGPYQKQEFLQKFKELGVPDSLKIK
jgi:hypothetical protein